MRQNNFTLLEVLTALIVLTLGLSGLIWQLSIASNRALSSMENWERIHDLTAAAEYLLLHGPETELDESIFTGELDINYRYEEPQLPADTEVNWGRKRLQTLIVEALKDGEVIDSLRLDCWGEAL